MLDPHTTVIRLGGLAHGTALQRYGLSRAELAKAVGRRELERLRPGLFATSTLDPNVRVAALHGGALTCASALRVHGIWVLDDDTRPHVWVGRRGRVHEHGGCRCTSHFFRGVVPLGIVDVETALIQLFHCEGDESFFASLESALHLRRLSRAAKLRVRAALPASARWLVDLAGAEAESGLESLLRLRLHVLGLILAAQVVIHGVGRVDFVVGGRLIIEVDGKENHTGAAKRHRDLMRDAAASALGYETLRFSYGQIVHDWPTVQAAILGAMARLQDHA
ncbi:endonuclease domain-containing protein [Microbacterium tumbae]